MIRPLAYAALLLCAACSRPPDPDTDRPVEPQSGTRAAPAMASAGSAGHVAHAARPRSATAPRPRVDPLRP